MEQGSDGSTHFDFIVDGKVSCVRSFMTSDFITENISGQRQIELQYGIKGPGGICGANHILIELRMILEKTVLEGLSHLFSLKKIKLHLGFGQKDCDRWLSAGSLHKKAQIFQMELSGELNRRSDVTSLFN